MSDTIVAVEFDLRRCDSGDIVVLRICGSSDPVIVDIGGGEWVRYEIGLIVPLIFGVGIQADQYGEPMHGMQSAGRIEFALKDALSTYVEEYVWEGNTLRVFAIEQEVFHASGSLGDPTYVGRVSAISHDAIANKVTVETAGAGLDLDKPFTDRQYGEVINQDKLEFAGVTISAAGFVVTFSGGDLIAHAGVRGGDTHIWTIGLAEENLNTNLVVEGVTTTTITYDQAVSGASAQWSFSRVVPGALQNQPYPFTFGQVASIEPRPLDILPAAFPTFHISYRAPIPVVDEVRVGSIPWGYHADFMTSPEPGEWTLNPNLAAIIFGSLVDGEVRADVRAYLWETCTTAQLLTELIQSNGGAVDAATFAILEAAAPEKIGYDVRNSASLSAVLDEIITGMGAWLVETDEGYIAAGLVSAPDATSAYAPFTELDVSSCQLVKIVNPVWRIPLEYRRNWQPASQFFEGATTDQRAAQQVPGLLIPPWQDFSILNRYPRALKVPTIRSLVQTLVDANAVAERLWNAWSVERRVYQLQVQRDPLPPVYSTVEIDFEDVAGVFRLVSRTRSIGGGLATVEAWG